MSAYTVDDYRIATTAERRAIDAWLADEGLLALGVTALTTNEDGTVEVERYVDPKRSTERTVETHTVRTPPPIHR